MKLVFFSLLLVISQYVDAQYQYGDIRLVGGSYQWEGRVEIYKSGRWGTITDTQWSSDEAQVVCRKLGLFKPGAVPLSGAYFGEGSGPIHMDYISCTGTEYSLTDCETSSSSTSSDHSEDVGVQCQPADGSYREGDIRLVGGTHDWEGRVEIYMAGTWGTVSDDDWTEDDAQVVCRQLGFPTTGAVAQCCAHFGRGSGPVHVMNVVCSGSETSITECSNSDTPRRGHTSDVGVQCQPRAAAVSPGTVRIVEGSHQWDGRVEIYLSGTWGTISIGRSGLQSTSTYVVCRQLGYTADPLYTQYSDEVASGRGPIAMRNPGCSGYEFRLTDCTYDLDTSSSSHDTDWGVKCSPVTPQEGDIHLQGDRVDVFVTGKWGTVSFNGWTAANTRVVCRQLGYTVPAAATPTFELDFHDSERDPPQLISSVNCTGSESKLLDCPHTTEEESDGELDDVHISCYQDRCYKGQIRLVGGQTKREGRVEMCLSYDSSWGTFCDKQWSPAHTRVPCRYLGYADEGIFFNSSVFGHGIGPIFDGYLNCNGSESSIFDCPHFLHSYTGCTHSDDVSIRCEPAACGDGQIRLLNGEVDHQSGVLEVCFNQRWGIVENYYDSIGVVCRQLGYSNGGYMSYSQVETSVPLYLSYVRCFGTESNILDCSYGNTTDWNTDNIYYSTMKGIVCRTDRCNNGELRLTEADVEWEGRLEVCVNQRWGTVSDDGWSEDNAQVVCRDLGYEINPSEYVFYRPWHSSVSLPIHIHNVVCSGTEGSLLHCSNSSGSIYNHSRDVGVKCQRPSCSDGDVRLVNGENRNEGYVQVCFNQRWGTIYNDGWEFEETKVICRQLGYLTQEYFDYYYDDSYFRVTTPIYMDTVRCTGREQKITDCSYNHNKYNYTRHNNDVGIRCRSSSDPSSTDSTYEPSDTHEPHTTGVPTAHTSSTDATSSDHDDGCTCPESTSSSNDTDKNDSKFTAVLIFAIVSWVITGLSLVVAVGTVIHHFVSNRKKNGGYDQMQLQNQGSDDSVPGMVDAEGMEHEYYPPTVEVGKGAVL